jgi:alkylation response protein AidB-like acyl-CoA dehydrogenase
MDSPGPADFRASVRGWVNTEIVPSVAGCDEAGSFARTPYRRASELGLLQLGSPAALGGTPCPLSWRLIATEEIACAGSGGLMASLFSHPIGLPPTVEQGSAELRQCVGPPVLAGEQIAPLTITEPGGGSAVARLRTTARRDGDACVLEGEKTFITSGQGAAWIPVALRTGGRPGAGGISLHAAGQDRLVVQRRTRRPGGDRRPPRGAHPGRHGLHARHPMRTPLPRGQGNADRRRRDRDHEKAGLAAAGAMIQLVRDLLRPQTTTSGAPAWPRSPRV